MGWMMPGLKSNMTSGMKRQAYLLLFALFLIFMVYGLSSLISSPNNEDGYFSLVRPVIGFLSLIAILITSILVIKKVENSNGKDTPTVDKNEKWYTEWRLGNKLYEGHLDLKIFSDGRITGERQLISANSHDYYEIVGCKSNNYYRLEYHNSEEGGGGVIMFYNPDNNPGRANGALTYIDCDDPGILKCYRNKWLKLENKKEYNKEFQVLLGQSEFPAHNNV